MNPINYSGSSGYQAGVVSSPNIAFNGSGDPASITSSNPFTFNSAYFTGVFRNGLSITVTGLHNGVLVGSDTFTVSAYAPTLEIFDFANVTEVDFSSAGGTQVYGFGFNQFSMDNVKVNAVPEPSNYALFGLGAVVLIVAFRRKTA